MLQTCQGRAAALTGHVVGAEAQDEPTEAGLAQASSYKLEGRFEVSPPALAHQACVSAVAAVAQSHGRTKAIL
jgi:hypothetical protein